MCLTSTRRSNSLVLCLLLALGLSTSHLMAEESPYHCPKEHVYVYCGELHDDLNHYGYPTAAYGYSIQVQGPWVKEHLDQCGLGYIERKWKVKAGYDWVWCSQTIHIKDKHGSGFDYNSVYWPKDYHMKDCGGSMHPDHLPKHYSWPEFPHKGCAKLGLRYYDKAHPIHSTYHHGYGHSYGKPCKVIHRTWELIDWCQYNSGYGGYGSSKGKWTYVQKIYVYDHEAPTITFCSDDIEANGGDCMGEKTFVEIPPVQAKDDCGTVYYAFSRKKIEDGVSYHSYTGGGVRYSGANASGYYEPGKTLVTFEAFDVCGNTTECQIIVNVEAVDTKPPSVIGISSLTAVLVQSDTNDGKIELWPSEFNTSSYDNCTDPENLKFSLEPSVFTCEDFGSNQVKFTVTDEAGNSDYIMVEVIVQANSFECLGGVISGNISSDDGEGVGNVQVRLMEGMEQMTSEEGSFAFDDIPLGQDVLITPYKSDDHMSGIDMYDYTLLSLHVDGVRELKDPYSLIAADINGDQEIDYNDLRAMQRLITGIDQLMPQDAWKIFNRDFEFPDTVHPLQVEIPQNYVVQNYDGSDVHVPFMAVKVGDLGSLKIEEGSGDVGEQEIRITDQILEQNETKRIPFAFSENSMGNSLTLTMDVNPQNIEVISLHEVALDRLGEVQVFQDERDPSKLAITWFSLNEVEFAAGEVLFEIEIMARQEALLSRNLNLSSELARAEIKAVSVGVKPISLQYDSPSLSEDITLFQNNPNPFREQTQIGFFLPSAGDIVFSVRDANGRTLMQRDGYFDKGYQELRIDRSDLPTYGLLFYEVSNGQQRTVKKMMVIN